MPNKLFEHFWHALCESGVASNLLAHYGIPITESLAFGMGTGLFLLYLPFLKVDCVCGTSYRSHRGSIIKTLMKFLGVSYKMQRLDKDKTTAKAALDELLNENIPVGIIYSVYFLDYLPEIIRFHFNVQNLLAIGRENNTYKISNPVLETSQTINYSALENRYFRKSII
ncbi:MAG TPA: BtrH N-terminal domain-containing protein [Edaphocola sp.]|nr:BtrH N-terminal domain-containing protein [Edaphocola sp.]